MCASSLTLFTSTENFVFFFNGLWVLCNGVCSSTLNWQNVMEDSCGYVKMCMCWNDIRWIWLAKIHEHHLLRIIVWSWAIRNSGCRVVYWYYHILLLLYTSRMFICGLILHMLFSYLFLFNITVYGFLAHCIFKVFFLLVVSSMIAPSRINGRIL